MKVKPTNNLWTAEDIEALIVEEVPHFQAGRTTMEDLRFRLFPATMPCDAMAEEIRRRALELA